jgi:serine/threonine protein kinase
MSGLVGGLLCLCIVASHLIAGDWRSPEEYHDFPLNEKIDVYSLGNNMYALLTGVSVFYEESDISEVQRRVKAGETPYVDHRWRERSYAERKMIEIMERMWTYNADERIDIFEAVILLRDAWDETRRSYMHEDDIHSPTHSLKDYHNMRSGLES